MAFPSVVTCSNLFILFRNINWYSTCQVEAGLAQAVECLATGWTTGRSGFDPRQEQKGFFLYHLCPDRLWGPPSLLSNGYRGPFPGGKALPGRDADHSPHLVLRSWMSRSYISSPPQAPLRRVAGLLFFTCQVFQYISLIVYISP
jgi:hypothetical protein